MWELYGLQAYVLLLLNYVKRYFHQQVSTEEADQAIRSADLKLLSRYQKLIETHMRVDTAWDYAKNLHSPTFYADLLNVHPNHLNAVVKKMTGLTALNHIHNHLMALSKSYLAQTNWSVKEIAYTLQFDSPNNFSSFFKRSTGMTPLSYRKEVNL